MIQLHVRQLFCMPTIYDALPSPGSTSCELLYRLVRLKYMYPFIRAASPPRSWLLQGMQQDAQPILTSIQDSYPGHCVPFSVSDEIGRHHVYWVVVLLLWWFLLSKCAVPAFLPTRRCTSTTKHAQTKKQPQSLHSDRRGRCTAWWWWYICWKRNGRNC